MITQELGPLFTVITSLGSAAIASAGLGIWIMRQFNDQRQNFYQALDAQRERFELKVDNHERIDQERHEDNLAEFKTISNTLTRLEYSGTSKGKHIS